MSASAGEAMAQADDAMSPEDVAITIDGRKDAVPMVTDAMMRALSAMTLSEHPGAGVAGNYEIIERILLHLPRQDLSRSWLVNKAFKDVFTTSQEVKKKLRVDLPKPGKTAYLNTRPTGPFEVMRLQWLRNELFLDIYGFDKRRARRSHSDAGWRSIPLFLPEAESRYLISQGTHCQAPPWHGKCSLSGLVTMGQLSDSLLEITDRHSIRDKVYLLSIIYPQ